MVFSYVLGILSGGDSYVLNQGPVNRYRIEFNTGLVDTFSWVIGVDSTHQQYNLSGFAFFQGTTESVPEPGTLTLFGLGLLGLFAQRRCRASL
ncbi:MAG: PEP-CTERM sorting domain-containing protein [Proteobacteria bacterium]|nr:PEP-CTERM sorting domain-containing protein [Pseudomonadota bacterium]